MKRSSRCKLILDELDIYTPVDKATIALKIGLSRQQVSIAMFVIEKRGLAKRLPYKDVSSVSGRMCLFFNITSKGRVMAHKVG